MDLHDHTILVVDDESSVVELLSEYLRTRGHTVCVASNGVEALDLLEEGGIDVVLTDMKMPRMSGPELLATIRQRAYPVGTILMTGQGSIDSAVRVLKGGAHDYLLKPFSLRDLYTALGRVAERLKLERETHRLRRVTRLVQIAHEATEVHALLEELCTLAGTEGAHGIRVEVEGYAPCAIGTLEGEEESLPMLVRGEQRGSLTIYGAEERSGPALLASLTVVADAVSRLELQAALEASEG